MKDHIVITLLEDIIEKLENPYYETEYDNRMEKICFFCDNNYESDPQHSENCATKNIQILKNMVKLLKPNPVKIAVKPSTNITINKGIPDLMPCNFPSNK